jgi:hypothetical protein
MLTETQVANRGLQRCGASGIADGALWTEDSKNASEIRKAYEIARRTEIRRNVWRFSIREQILRALDTTTDLIVFAAWSNVTAYVINDVVLGTDGNYWQAIKAGTNHDPTLRGFDYWVPYIGQDVANLWNTDITYMAGELVYNPAVAAGVHCYISLTNQNEGNAVTDTANWMKFTTDPTRSDLNFIYPIGAGPSSNLQTRNVFKLPYGFIREAPQAPKQGSYLPLGAPAGLWYTDWQYENGYFTSMQPGPVPYRYAANIADPNAFDPMFVDGFACRLALDVCEVLTQSVNKVEEIAKLYAKFMSEARTVNGIETGPVEPPEDAYISSRY